MSGEGMESESRGGGSVREVRMPLGLYHDRLHNVYIAAGTLGAAIAIVGVVVSIHYLTIELGISVQEIHQYAVHF